MTGEESAVSTGRLKVVKAQGEEPVFKAGDAARISVRFPIGHFQVPTFIRGKRGWIESAIEPLTLNLPEYHSAGERTTGSCSWLEKVVGIRLQCEPNVLWHVLRLASDEALP